MTDKILITGGTGVLGRKVAARLGTEGAQVRIASRRRAEDMPWDWYPVDLYDGFGLKAALDGVHTVIHLASGARSFNYTTDTMGTRNLIRAAKEAGVRHLMYVSIVGVDRIPFRYYRKKLVAENFVRQSGLPFTILRATQFHEFIDELFSRGRIGRWLVIPTSFKVQPISTDTVSGELARLVREGPQGKIVEIGGPEVTTLGEMARVWMERCGVPGRILPLPSFGRMAAGFKKGHNTCALPESDECGWEWWLRENGCQGEKSSKRTPLREVALAGERV